MLPDPWASLVPQLAPFPDLSLQPRHELAQGDFGLAGIKKLLNILGNPQDDFPSLHIAGTNGKGSLTAFCSASLVAAGHKVGAYTSPHLLSPFQGIRLAGQPIGVLPAQRLLERILPEAKKIPTLTRFELLTAVAFLYFAEEGADVAVIEVGLGGRLDATNVINPEVAIITPIDLEHQGILGDSLEEIAAHKAGIIKPRRPVVSTPQPEAALRVIQVAAQAQRAPLTLLGRDLLFESLSGDLNGQHVRVWQAADPQHAAELEVGMPAPYQAANAAAAYAALLALEDRGIAISKEAIRRGLKSARWPGRFEVLHGPPTIILDAAHTPAAARALRYALDELIPDVEIVALMGVSADKNVAGLLEALAPRLASVIAIQSSHSRAMPAADLAVQVARTKVPVRPEPDLAAALKKAQAGAFPGRVLLVFGSVFVVEEAGYWLKTA